MIRLFLFTLLLGLTTTSTQGQEIHFHHGDWASALEKAGKENKLLFLDAFTTWCGPCKMMDKQTFTDAKVIAFYNQHFINVKMNMEKGEGISLARQYSIQAYPTFLFIDANGQIVHRVAGFHNAENFLKLGATALDPSQQLQTADLRFQQGDRDPDFLYTYAYRRYYSMDGSHGPVVQAYLATQSDWTTTKNREFLFEFAEYLDDTIFMHFITHRAAFEDHFGTTAVVRKIEEVLDMANFSGEPDWLKTESLLVQLFPNDVDQRLLALQMNYYQQSDATKEYVRTALQYFKKYAANDADALNDAAWTFYEHVEDPKALKEAIKWAQKAVKLDDNYHNNDTLAALYAKTGQKRKAQKTGQHAINLAKENGEDYEMTRLLLEGL